MTWAEVRQRYPNEWLLIEATQAHSENGKRVVTSIAVLEVFQDSTTAWRSYTALHRTAPQRELFVVHTSHPELEIKELHWFGVRSAL